MSFGEFEGIHGEVPADDATGRAPVAAHPIGEELYGCGGTAPVSERPAASSPLQRESDLLDIGCAIGTCFADDAPKRHRLYTLWRALAEPIAVPASATPPDSMKMRMEELRHAAYIGSGIQLDSRVLHPLADYVKDVVERWRTLRPQPEWLPIKTAPKDGTPILVRCPTQADRHCASIGERVVFWRNGDWLSLPGWWSSIPTLWTPIPKLPLPLPPPTEQPK